MKSQPHKMLGMSGTKHTLDATHEKTPFAGATDCQNQHVRIRSKTPSP
jgi:hypothetical protein